MVKQERIEIITTEERVKRDPRALARVTLIGTDTVLWRVTETQPDSDQEVIAEESEE